MEAGASVGVYTVGLDTPLRLVINLDFCRWGGGRLVVFCCILRLVIAVLSFYFSESFFHWRVHLAHTRKFKIPVLMGRNTLQVVMLFHCKSSLHTSDVLFRKVCPPCKSYFLKGVDRATDIDVPGTRTSTVKRILWFEWVSRVHNLSS